MVPLRIDPCETAPARDERFRRPRLTLEDVSSSPAPRVRRTSPLKRWENLLFAVVAASVVLFFLFSAFASLWHIAQVSDNAARGVQTPAVNVTVAPGDTLWKYAARYGTSNRSILDRVESIARANKISPEASLIPGQHLQVPVENPVELAKLFRQHRLSVASATR